MKFLQQLTFLTLTAIGLSSCGFESAQPWNNPIKDDDLGITNKPVSADLVNKITNPYKIGEAEKLFLFEHKILVEKRSTGAEGFIFKFFEFKEEDGSTKRAFIVTKSNNNDFVINSINKVQGIWGPSEDGNGLELIAQNGAKWSIKKVKNININ